MKKKILFLLGSANLSGGTYVIFQHAAYLQANGYDVTIGLVFMTSAEFAALKTSEKCWHDAIKNLHFIHISEANQYHYDVAIFTWWATVFYLEKVPANSFVYFVQSIESRFYQENETFMRDLVNRTYKIGLPVITEANWIQNYLIKNYANQCSLVKNGILKSVYTSVGEKYAEKPKQGLRILVEGPIDIHYKNVPKTIGLCLQANVGEIWLLTSTAVKSYPGVDRIFSQVPIYDVPKIYRSCDVIVKLSYVEGMFGPPLEMFHCGGTAIVYDVTGHDEYIVHDYNALVIKTDDEFSVVHSLQKLNSDRDLLQRLQQGAQETARNWIDWQQSSSNFAAVMATHASQPQTDPQKKSIQNNMQTYLREHIWVAIQSHSTLLSAEPLYHSGHYALTIPIDNLSTKVEIMLGKHYRQVWLTLLSLIKINKKTNELTLEQNHPAVNFSASEMTKLGNTAVYHCLSESSAVLALINHTTLNHSENQYYIRLEFRPIQIAAQCAATV